MTTPGEPSTCEAGLFDALSRMTSYSDGATTVGYAYDWLDRIATRDTDAFTP